MIGIPEEIGWLALCSFGVAVFIGITSLPVILRVARIKHLFDTPNVRSVHQVNIPTLGGIAIFASLVIPVLLFSDFRDDIGMNFIVASVMLLFFSGVKDDILIITVSKKLIIQILAALIVIIFADIRIKSFYGIFDLYDIAYPYSVVFSLFVFIVTINAYNLIDGIDGLAAGTGIIISLTFAYLFYKGAHVSLTVLAVSLAGSHTGFLFYNFSRKNKIFMGDTGSLISGFLVGIMAIKFIDFQNVLSGNRMIENEPTVAILILAIPLFDALRMFIIRVSRGRSPFRADRGHLHHILLGYRLPHFLVSVILYAANILFIILAFTLVQQVGKLTSVAILAVLFLLYCLSAWLLSRKIIHHYSLMYGNGDKVEIEETRSRKPEAGRRKVTG